MHQQTHGSSYRSVSTKIIKYVARGYTNAEIAAVLVISIKTVETYRARGMEKLVYAHGHSWCKPP